MTDWAVRRLDSTDDFRAGTAPSLVEAWTQTVAAVMDEFVNDGTLTGCAITVDATPGLLLAGRTDAGELDVPATRAAAERLALACSGAKW
jgi:hypothetical protein